MWNLYWDFPKHKPGGGSNDRGQSTAFYKGIDTSYTHVCFWPVPGWHCNCPQRWVRLAVWLTSGINPWKVVESPMMDDPSKSTMSLQIHSFLKTWGCPYSGVWRRRDYECWMSKWGKNEQRPKDGGDKGKKWERRKNKDINLGSWAALEHVGLNQVI